MVANPNSFDAGIFIVMILIGFVCMFLYTKLGALLLLISVITFTIAGLLIVTGYDVSSFTVTMDSSGTTLNQTTYLIGNGQFPETGTGQLWMGYSFIVLAAVVGVIFLDQTLKGNLIRGD